MAKARKEKKPIMSDDEERYMAFTGLVQWTAAVIEQHRRMGEANAAMRPVPRDPNVRWVAMSKPQVECHFFAIAAHKVIEHKDWVLGFGLCKNVDFSEIDAFSVRDIRDLRNMREHQKDYFSGEGVVADRWRIEMPEYSADASSVVGTMIGGRLNYAAFGAAAARLLPRLLDEAVPFPQRQGPANSQVR